MPTIDGGHIFLTLLAPVKLGEVLHPDGQITTHSHMLREELSILPTAQQSPVSIDTGLCSPFARCTRTHFLRLLVIDQPMFNGKDASNPLVDAVTGASRLTHQPFDVLSRPWLVLSADIDRRPGEADDGIASWAEGMWTRNEAEMRAVFSHCHGFETVRTAADFAAYVKRCQIETTMSFNDYWQGRPPLKGETLKSLAIRTGVVALGVTALMWLLIRPASLWWLLAFLLLGVLAGAALSIWALWNKGAKAFPAAPDSDLKSVLKSLHVQQRFAIFAGKAQGLEAAALHSAFGKFLADVRPEDLESPTQAPGVIRSDGVDLVEHKAVGQKRVVL
jgi:hypothetical protein